MLVFIDVANRLIFQKANGFNVPVAFTFGQGTPDVSSFDAGAFKTPWTVAEIHARLNDLNHRQQAQLIGRGLFELLFVPGSPLRTAWDNLTAQEQIQPLEIAFEDPAFRGYPWELLQQPNMEIPALLNSFVRRAGSKQGTSAGSDWPFRLLVLVGSTDSAIGAVEELDAIRRALSGFERSIDLFTPTRMPASAEEVTELLRWQPHMVHFIGHGATRGGQNVLMFEDAPTWYWNTQEMRLGFQTAKCMPRAVFLNCCRSGAETNALQSVQDVFSNLGVPAVIAMQADVRGDQAAKFSREFYLKALAGEKPGSVAVAVNSARLSLGAIAEINWALPTLTLAGDTALDHQLRAPRAWPSSQDFKVCQEFANARLFANCRMERSKLVHWRTPIDPTAKSPRLLILKAPASSGKSHLLQWSMESWAVEGSRICYIRVDKPRGKHTLDWLVRLRAGDVKDDGPEEQRLLQLGLPPEPFEPFYRALGKSLSIEPGPGQIAAIDGLQTTIPDDVDVARLFALYIDGLKQCGNLILVLDQVGYSSISEDVFALFRKHFLSPISKLEQDVRVVLVVPDEDHSRFKLDTFATEEARVVVLEIESNVEVLESLAVEALGYPEDEQGARETARSFLKKKGKSQGVARLFFCKGLVDDEQFPKPGRMR